jgi:hypothetical protein
MTNKSLLALLVCFLSACNLVPTSYGAAKDQIEGGYSDRLLAPGKYEIQIKGNGHTEKDTVKEYFKQRAGELCNGGEFKIITYKEDTYKSTERPYMYFMPQVERTRPYVTGVIECK